MSKLQFSDFYKKIFDNSEDLEQHRARLFVANEKMKVLDEDVTSSIFLASLVGIKEFYSAFFQAIGIKLKSNQKVHSYVQIGITDNSNEQKIPDGVIVITEGSTNPVVVWSAFIEFKTKSKLESEQISSYVKLAQKNNIDFDAIITVSNDFVSDPTHNPLNFKNKSNFKFYHFSWIRLQTILQYTIQQGINDDDQFYLAEQLSLYFNEHKYIKTFDQMNSNWIDYLRTIKTVVKLSKSKHKELLDDITNDWIQEEQDLGLKLKSKFYRDTCVKLTTADRKDLKNRAKTISEELFSSNSLTTIYKVKNALKDSPFQISSKRYLDIENKIILNTSTQLISFEIINNSCKYKSLKKQIQCFIYPIIESDPALKEEIKIDTYFSSKKEKLEKTLDQFHSDYKRDTITGIENYSSKDCIKKYKISISFDLSSSIKSRKKFITEIEQNFILFFSQLIEPFTS